jgi:hypothetical protein
MVVNFFGHGNQGRVLDFTAKTSIGDGDEDDFVVLFVEL